MTLRTTALIAGVLGVLLLAAGLYADANRPETQVTAAVAIDTPVAVAEPAVFTLAPEGRMAFTGTGTIEAHVARPVDAEAWLTGRSATFVTGLAEWEELSVREVERIEAPAPDPDAETPADGDEAAPEDGAAEDGAAEDGAAEDGAAEEPAAEDEATEDGATEDGATEDETEEEATEPTSADHWRDTWRGTNRLSIAVADIPAGLTLVVESVDGSPLTQTSLTLERTVNDGWITPLIIWGAILAAVGFIALLLMLIDTRPLQARTEDWRARRRRKGREESAPPEGSRRARRRAGKVMPVADLDHEPGDERIGSEGRKSAAGASDTETVNEEERA